MSGVLRPARIEVRPGDRTHNRLAAMFGPIMGVGLDRVYVDLPKGEDVQEPARVTAVVTGYSPSLHRQRIQATRLLPPFDDGAVDIAFGALAVSQKARSMAAYGMSRRQSPYSAAPLAKVDHLMVDRAVHALGLGEGISFPVWMRDGLSELHQFHQVDGGPMLHDGTRGVLEIERADEPDIRMALMTVHPIGRGAGRIGFDGVHLAISDRELPESSLASLVGRPAGDLVAVHPLLDGRPIITAVNTQDGVLATVAPDPVDITPERPS